MLVSGSKYRGHGLESEDRTSSWVKGREDENGREPEHARTRVLECKSVNEEEINYCIHLQVKSICYCLCWQL